MIIFCIIQFTWSRGLLDSLSSGLATLLTGVFLYSLGGEIRLYNPFDSIRTYVVIIIIIINEVIVCLSSYNITVTNIENYYRYAADQTFIQYIPLFENYSIVVIIVGVALFELFRRIEIPQNKILNFFGKATFMVYLIHDNTFFYSIWDTRDWITLLDNQTYIFIFDVLILTLKVFGIGVCAYSAYIGMKNIYKKFEWIVRKI